MDTQKLIWSWGTSDEIQYHGPFHRGTKLRNILDPTPNPPDLSQSVSSAYLFFDNWCKYFASIHHLSSDTY